MILWTLITGVILHFAGWGKTAAIRSNGGLALLVWCVASVVLSALGGNTLD